MEYDTIKLLNLETLNLDLEYSHITKDKTNFTAFIKLAKKNYYVCPCCGSINNTVHDYRHKQIKHGLFLDNELIIDFKFRRLYCKDCGKIFNEDNPFCDSSRDKVSEYTKRSIVFKLKDIHCTYTMLAKDYHLTAHSVMNIFDEYIPYSRRSLDEYISFDEFYRGKKSKQKYAFVIFNPIKNEVIDILPDRRKYKLIKYFLSNYKYEELKRVKYISIDMYFPYKEVIKKVFPNAIIAVDSFHVIKHLNDAITNYRIKVMNEYEDNHNDICYYFLKKFHYFFTKDYDKIYNGDIKIPKLKIKAKKEYILKRLLSFNERLTKMYDLKERYRFFNTHTESTNDLVIGQLETFIHEFIISPDEQYQKFGKMLLNWKDEIINSFIYINGKRLSNGPIESLNSRIKIIIKNGCGLPDFDRLRRRIMFCTNQNQPWQK